VISTVELLCSPSAICGGDCGQRWSDAWNAPQPRPPRRHRLGIAEATSAHRRAARRRRRPCHAPRSWRWWAPDGRYEGKNCEGRRSSPGSRVDGARLGVGMPAGALGLRQRRGTCGFSTRRSRVNAGRLGRFGRLHGSLLDDVERGTGDPLSDGSWFIPGSSLRDDVTAVEERTVVRSRIAARRRSW